MAVQRVRVADVDLVPATGGPVVVWVVDPDGGRWFHSSYTATPVDQAKAELVRRRLLRRGTAWVTSWGHQPHTNHPTETE